MGTGYLEGNVAAQIKRTSNVLALPKSDSGILKTLGGKNCLDFRLIIIEFRLEGTLHTESFLADNQISDLDIKAQFSFYCIQSRSKYSAPSSCPL